MRHESHGDLAFNFPPEAEFFLESCEAGKTDGISPWRSEFIEKRDGSAIEGKGLFATVTVQPGSLIAIKTGHVENTRYIKDNQEMLRGSFQQIGPNRFLVGHNAEEAEKNLVGYNHSCDPNALIVLPDDKRLAYLVTSKPISAGEEITVDYSVSMMTNAHRFLCKCGSPNCRKFIDTRWDWMDPKFQREHWQEFPGYIKEQIEKLDPQSVTFRGETMRLAALKSADMIDWLETEIKRVENRHREIVDAKNNSRIRKLSVGIYSFRVKRYIEKLRWTELEFAKHFVASCPLYNIEECGIDRNDPTTIEPNLDKLANFAHQLNLAFN